MLSTSTQLLEPESTGHGSSLNQAISIDEAHTGKMQAETGIDRSHRLDALGSGAKGPPPGSVKVVKILVHPIKVCGPLKAPFHEATVSSCRISH